MESKVFEKWRVVLGVPKMSGGESRERVDGKGSIMCMRVAM